MDVAIANAQTTTVRLTVDSGPQSKVVGFAIVVVPPKGVGTKGSGPRVSFVLLDTRTLALVHVTPGTKLSARFLWEYARTEEQRQARLREACLQLDERETESRDRLPALLLGEGDIDGGFVSDSNRESRDDGVDVDVGVELDVDADGDGMRAIAARTVFRQNDVSREQGGSSADLNALQRERSQQQEQQKQNHQQQNQKQQFRRQLLFTHCGELSSFRGLAPHLASAATGGLEAGHMPRACLTGTTGALLVYDKLGRPCGVFKAALHRAIGPAHAAAAAVSEQRRLEPVHPITLATPRDDEASEEHERRPSATDGEGQVLREIAAYALDRTSGGFHRVPATTLVSLPLPTNGLRSVGSLQAFVPNNGDTEEFPSARFSTTSVHRIGILDIRLCNADRNGENMLARPVVFDHYDSEDDVASLSRPEQFDLIPIDHAMCLGETLDQCYFEWMSWKQSHVPFDAETLKFIGSINPDRDARTVQQVAKRARKAIQLAGSASAGSVVRTFVDVESMALIWMRLTGRTLKQFAAAGKCLYEIGHSMCRDPMDPDTPSLVEQWAQTAARTSGGTVDQSFFSAFEKLIDNHLNEACLPS